MKTLALVATFVTFILVGGAAFAQPAPTDPYAGGAPQAPASQPSAPIPDDPSAALREANGAATAGDWSRVSVVVNALLARSLDRADFAEAHRLAGIAAVLAQPPNPQLAEHHFLEYLKIDLDGQLDPALYPPEVIQTFSDVRARHAAELRALRPKQKRYWVLNLVPPFGQFQNKERTKGIVVGALLGTFLVANVSTYFVLRSWCFKQSRNGNESVGCDADPNNDRYDSASSLRALNITAGVGLIVTYVWGVYDGVRGYRRTSRENTLGPFATATNGGTTFGVAGTF
jgi:hypothetical protein